MKESEMILSIKGWYEALFMNFYKKLMNLAALDKNDCGNMLVETSRSERNAISKWFGRRAVMIDHGVGR